MSNEDLIEEAAKAMYSMTNALSMSGAKDLARAALAVFEAAQKPTDDEREALDQIMRNADGYWPEAREAILALFRRPVPPEPSAVCAWCPSAAHGSAWHNDGRLHPSCGQIDHGQGWVPPYRLELQTEPTDAHREIVAIDGPAYCTGCDWESRRIGINSHTQFLAHASSVQGENR